jgi:translation initiation factor IF-3
MNDRIRHPQIRVVDDNGDQLGILPTREALNIARGKGLDLIEVAPQAQPPVCKIMDYGKFKYETAKKEKDQSKKHKQSDLKGIKMFPHIDQHDFQVKLRSAIKFLQDGDKVKVTIAFKGREITHPEFGEQQMEKFIAGTTEIGAVVEKPPTREGRQLIMILSPRGSGANKPKPVAAAPKPASVPASAPANGTAAVVAPSETPAAVAPAPVPAAEAPASPVEAKVAEPVGAE